MNTDEMSAEELAEWCLSQPTTRCDADRELEEAMRQIDAEDRRAKSLDESPMWKEPYFSQMERELAAADFEKSRQITKHYIDGAPQPVRAPDKSRMGHPKRGADGQILRDANGLPVWEADGDSNPTSSSRANVTADGRIDPKKSIMGNPVRQPDGSVKWVAT
jgi:hypothetical protein